MPRCPTCGQDHNTPTNPAVSRVDAPYFGSCNFCASTTDKVWQIRGIGHGPQLAVRVCDACMNYIKHATKVTP
jgi:hypothetical protein